MARREEMEAALKLSQGRAARYREAAQNGGEGRMTAAQAAEEARQFDGYAAGIAASLAQQDGS